MTDKLVKRSEIKTVDIVVDGGCKGNGKKDAHAYGSFAVYVNKKLVHAETNVYTDVPQTNNVAEYKALLDALGYMIRDARRRDLEFTVHTDSQLVYGQWVEGNKVKAKHLIPLFKEVKELNADLNFKMVKQPRENIVAALGH